VENFEYYSEKTPLAEPRVQFGLGVADGKGKEEGEVRVQTYVLAYHLWRDQMVRGYKEIALGHQGCGEEIQCKIQKRKDLEGEIGEGEVIQQDRHYWELSELDLDDFGDVTVVAGKCEVVAEDRGNTFGEKFRNLPCSHNVGESIAPYFEFFALVQTMPKGFVQVGCRSTNHSLSLHGCPNQMVRVLFRSHCAHPLHLNPSRSLHFQKPQT